MTKKPYILTGLVIASCLLSIPVLSQTISLDSAAIIPVKNAVAVYYNAVNENYHLKNGSEYAGYNIYNIGHPFFDSAAFENGTVYYEGVLYDHLPVQYDIYRDIVVTNEYYPVRKISLVTEKISWFSVWSHVFVRLSPDSSNSNIISPGFYDRVYDGKTSVWVKRKKILRDDPVTNGEVKTRYVQYDYYFIRNNNHWMTVNSEKSLMDFFKDRKKEIRGFLKKNKIRYRKQPEYTIVQAVQYYDRLTN